MVARTGFRLKGSKNEMGAQTVGRRQRTAHRIDELEKKLSELNAEKMNLLLRNEHLRHELYILRRKYERLLDELQ